jgi:hypothetical protein
MTLDELIFVLERLEEATRRDYATSPRICADLLLTTV